MESRFRGKSHIKKTLDEAAKQLCSEKDIEKLRGPKKQSRKKPITYSSLEEKADSYFNSRKWGDTEKIVEAYQLALIETVSSDSKSRINNKLGSFYLAIHKHEHALQYFESAILHNPRNANAYYGLAMINFQANNFEKSFNYCNLAIESNSSILWPTSNKLHHLNCILLRAMTLFEQKKFFEAFSDYKNILDTVIDKKDFDRKELNEFKTIRKYTRDNLYILLTSNADFSGINESFILDIVEEYSINEQLKLLNRCQDSSTSLGKYMKAPSLLNGTISFFQNGTQVRIYNKIIEIKNRQVEQYNQELANNSYSCTIDPDASVTDSDSDDNFWIQKSDEDNESFHLTNLNFKK